VACYFAWWWYEGWYAISMVYYLVRSPRFLLSFKISIYYPIFYPHLFLKFRLVDVVMTYLSSGDACRDMATVLATRLFTRSDVKESHLPIFLDWVKLVII